MSLYIELIKSGVIMRRPFRTFSNAFFIFRSKGKSGKPFMLKIESSAVCNLKCKMCPITKGLSREQGFLSFENFKKAYDEIKPPYVNLTGIGEPLLNLDIFRIIKYAKKKRSLVKIDTNATLLDKEKIKKLIDANPSFVSVSIDGTTKKVYEAIRRGADFEKVINNLRELIKYKNRVKSKTKIQLFFVLQKTNILELGKFIKFGKELGVDTINGTIVSPMGKNKNFDNLKISRREISRAKKEIKKLTQAGKVSINIENIPDFLENPQKIIKTDKPCFWPWYQIALTWDGYITPCCVMCNNEIVWGNGFKDGLMKVWNNKKAQKFRRDFVRKRTGICATCSVDESFIFDKLKPLYKLPVINQLSSRK